MSKTIRALPAAAVLLSASLAQAATGVLNLEIGDPARRGRQAPVALDAITDTRTGELINPPELAKRLKDVRVLFIGEQHLSSDDHAVEFRVVQALHDAGRPVLIGLEMYPYSQDKVLADWTHGMYTEKGFVDLSGWYESWSHHWGYYREIFLYARDQGIPMYGVNVPRDVVKTVRTQGFEALAPEARAHMPPVIDTNSAEHRQLFRAYFDADDPLHAASMSEEAREGMYKAQTTWDGAMGWNAAQALQAHGGPDAIIVIFIGAGHVAYGLGAERQLTPHFKGPIRSLIPVPVRDTEGNANDTVRASYANFLWGVPPDPGPGLPVLGVSLMGRMGAEPSKVIEVERNSCAAQAGVQVGDVILRLDDAPIASTTDLQRKTGDYRWGDAARLEVRRGGKPLTLTVNFRRTPRPVKP